MEDSEISPREMARAFTPKLTQRPLTRGARRIDHPHSLLRWVSGSNLSLGDRSIDLRRRLAPPPAHMPAGERAAWPARYA
jgi:hypothetical protein